MFAEKFSSLINSYPQEADAFRRLAEYFLDMENRNGARVFDVRLDPHRLFEIAQAGSVFRLTKVVQILLEERIFERRILVRSPSGAGIEFRNYSELPDFVRDPVRDVDMEVTADNTESTYVVVK